MTMYDELTRADLQKMQEEIDYRTQVLRPKLIEALNKAVGAQVVTEIQFH